MPYTPGDEIAQGAPAEVGGLNPLLKLLQLLGQLTGAPGPVQQPVAPPNGPFAPGGAPGEMPATPPPLKKKMTQGK